MADPYAKTEPAPSPLYVHDRVVVVALWSSFRGWRGVVTQTKPWLMVRFDGEREPMRIEEPSVAREVTNHSPSPEQE